MKSHHCGRVLALLTMLAAVTLSAATAQAASGIVSGVLLFYQNQGNFCPAGRNCTGAKYTSAEYQTNQPFRDARVYVTRQSDGAILGQSVTDGAGFFVIAWADTSVGALTPVAANIEYAGEHSDGRFFIAAPNDELAVPPARAGNPIEPLRSTFTALPGFQWVNFPTFGTPGAANAIAQLHDGAQKMWANSLSQSFRMRLVFNDLEIQAFDDFICASSCAVGDANVVVINSATAALQPQGRVMHEMGHIASYLANTSWTLYDATRTVAGADLSLSGGGWSLGSAEWESAGWEEAIATHYADVGLYFPSAVQAFTCLDTSSCPATPGPFNIPLEPIPSCAVANSNAIVGNHVRYHWDNYDNAADYFGEVWSRPVSDVIDTVGSYFSGTGESRIDEAWNASRTALDDRNGRSAQDFRTAWLLRGVNSSTNLATNCGSAGD